MGHEFAFVTTVHDPDRRMLEHLCASVRHLGQYDAVFACATDRTHHETINALRSAIGNVEIVPTGAPGVAQRSVLRAALGAGLSSFFYCDFDRWLHWASHFPEELADLPRRIATDCPDAWYLCIGRTSRAFSTHPIAQQLPEEATNRALGGLLDHPIDATAGAAWLNRDGCELILQHSVAESKATDLEWPAIVMRAGHKRVQSLVIEGLEFETADFYRDEQERLGSIEAWMRDVYDRPEMLQQRLQLAVDSIAAMRSLLKGT